MVLYLRRLLQLGDSNIMGVMERVKNIKHLIEKKSLFEEMCVVKEQMFTWTLIICQNESVKELFINSVWNKILL